MYIIYPIENASAELEARYERFIEEGGYPLHVKAYQLDKDCAVVVEALPKLKEWHLLAVDILDDALNTCLKWAHKTNQTETRLSDILPLYTMNEAESGSEERVRASESFWESVLDPVYAKLSNWIDEAVGGENDEDLWRIWYIKPFKDKIILEKGMDYRVYDWQKRMKSGDWTHEETGDILAERVAG